MRRLKIFAVLMAVCLAASVSAADTAEAAGAAKNSADAFMSLPFGHTFARTKLRMERSGASAKSQSGDFLAMEGFFEGRPAVFHFSFDSKKGLKGKTLYLQSTGNASEDSRFYEALMQAYNYQYGKTDERPLPNTWAEGKIMMRCIWTPDRWTTITLTYNPEATVRFPGPSPKDRPIHLIYAYSKWD